ncbi:MAG: GGDEF domain-containing protein [Colwellia sp.]
MLKKLINLGTQHQPFKVVSRIKTTNIVALFTILISAIYTVNYIFVLSEPLVAFINSLFTLAYALTLTFNHFNAHKASKVWFFSILMLHLVVCTNIYVTNKTGFHLYFFLVPTGAFLLFELNEKFEKITLSIIATLLFFYCENTVNLTPLIELDNRMNHLIYQSVFFFNMIEVIFVLTIFANQMKINELKLTKQATTDSLTNIYNRHHFFELGKTALAMANEMKRPFSIILLDLDHFKNINDSYGQRTGNLALIEISKNIKQLCREPDYFARIGGDEFVIALPDTTQQEANIIAERILDSVKNCSLTTTDNINFSCSISIGVSSRSKNHDQLESLMIQAEKALCLAKKQGKGRIIS